MGCTSSTAVAIEAPTSEWNSQALKLRQEVSSRSVGKDSVRPEQPNEAVPETEIGKPESTDHAKGLLGENEPHDKPLATESFVSTVHMEKESSSELPSQVLNGLTNQEEKATTKPGEEPESKKPNVLHEGTEEVAEKLVERDIVERCVEAAKVPEVYQHETNIDKGTISTMGTALSDAVDKLHLDEAPKVSSHGASIVVEDVQIHGDDTGFTDEAPTKLEGADNEDAVEKPITSENPKGSIEGAGSSNGPHPIPSDATLSSVVEAKRDTAEETAGATKNEIRSGQKDATVVAHFNVVEECVPKSDEIRYENETCHEKKICTNEEVIEELGSEALLKAKISEAESNLSAESPDVNASKSPNGKLGENELVASEENAEDKLPNESPLADKRAPSQVHYMPSQDNCFEGEKLETAEGNSEDHIGQHAPNVEKAGKTVESDDVGEPKHSGASTLAESVTEMEDEVIDLEKVVMQHEEEIIAENKFVSECQAVDGSVMCEEQGLEDNAEEASNVVEPNNVGETLTESEAENADEAIDLEKVSMQYEEEETMAENKSVSESEAVDGSAVGKCEGQGLENNAVEASNDIESDAAGDSMPYGKPSRDIEEENKTGTLTEPVTEKADEATDLKKTSTHCEQENESQAVCESAIEDLYVCGASERKPSPFDGDNTEVIISGKESNGSEIHPSIEGVTSEIAATKDASAESENTSSNPEDKQLADFDEQPDNNEGFGNQIDDNTKEGSESARTEDTASTAESSPHNNADEPKKKKKKKKNRKRRKKKTSNISATKSEHNGEEDEDDAMSESSDDQRLRLTELLNVDPWSCEDAQDGFSQLELLIEANPVLCAQTYKLDSFNESVYPLSALCSIGAPLELVIKCVDAYEEALAEKDPWIGNPLHYACAYKASLHVVEMLVARRSASLTEANEFQRLPLHMACMFGAGSEVIAFLLESNARASEIIDKEGLMPLHLACDGDDVDQAVVERLVQANPKACTVQSIANGWTPLIIALTNVADIDIVKTIGDANLDAHKLVDDEGNTPLHVAISSEADFDVCKYLVDSYPDSVDIKNQGGETPLVLAERSDTDASIVDILKKQG